MDTEATALANRTCVAQARARAGPSMATAVTARHRAPQSQRDGNPGVLLGVSSRNRAKSPDLRALSRLCSRARATPARPTEASQCSEEQAALPPNGMCRESPGSPPGSSETSSAREAPQVPHAALPCPAPAGSQTQTSAGARIGGGGRGGRVLAAVPGNTGVRQPGRVCLSTPGKGFTGAPSRFPLAAPTAHGRCRPRERVVSR